MEMHVEGLSSLQTALAELPKRVESKANRAAVTAATTPIMAAVRAAVPRETGALKRGITRKINTFKGTTIGRIGAKRSPDGSKKGKARVPSRYLHLVEGGTKPHNGHPGTPARHILRTAYARTKAQAESLAAQKYTQVIEQEAAKVGSK